MCGGLLTVIEELRVEEVLICKQEEISKNYQEFKNIVNKRKVKVMVVKKRR